MDPNPADPADPSGGVPEETDLADLSDASKRKQARRRALEPLHGVIRPGKYRDFQTLARVAGGEVVVVGVRLKTHTLPDGSVGYSITPLERPSSKKRREA